MGEQQLRSLLEARDEAAAPSLADEGRAHTRRRNSAPIPPWQEWDDDGAHFAADLATDRGDVATIAMRRFRAPVASTMNPGDARPRTPSSRDDVRTAIAQPAPRNRPPHPAPLHRHGVVTMPPLSATDAAEGSSDRLRAPVAAPRRSRTTPALLPSSPPVIPAPAAYSYQPHLARIERVDDLPTRPARLAKASEPEAARSNDDWVVLVTHRTRTEAIEPTDIVDARDASASRTDEQAQSAVQTARINDIARIVAEADAQAAAAEAAAVPRASSFAAGSEPALATPPTMAADRDPGVAHHEVDFAATEVDATECELAALGASNVALAGIPAPGEHDFSLEPDGDSDSPGDDAAAPLAPADAATSGPHDPHESRGIAPEGTRSLEIPILYPEPADAAQLEPSIIVSADAAPPEPRLGPHTDPAMWPLRDDRTPLPPEAEHVLATALRDLIALDAAITRRPGALTVHPAHRNVRPRHLLISLGVLVILLCALYAIASGMF